MFGGVRQNNLFYMIKKEGRPVLMTGQVVSVSNPHPKYGQFQPGQVYGANTEMVVDVSVKFGDEKPTNFEGLPVNHSAAAFPDENFVVADSREAIYNEMCGLRKLSRNVLDSTPYHQGAVEAYDEMELDLNPSIAEKKEQEKKISVLEERMCGMEKLMNNMGGLMTNMGSTLTSMQSAMDSLNKSINKKNQQ